MLAILDDLPQIHFREQNSDRGRDVKQRGSLLGVMCRGGIEQGRAGYARGMDGDIPAMLLFVKPVVQNDLLDVDVARPVMISTHSTPAISGRGCLVGFGAVAPGIFSDMAADSVDYPGLAVGFHRGMHLYC